MKSLIDNIKANYDRLGYKFFEKGDYNLNLAAIRSSDITPNTFNDLFFITYKNNDCWHYRSFKITADPGLYWLQKPMNKQGTAILAAGQHVGAFEIGLHKGQYPALIQKEALPVYRDNDRDNALDLDPSKIQHGIFGINIHKAGKDSQRVDKWSAGCQVFANEADYWDYWSIIEKASSIWGNTFSYTLFTQDQIKL
jgi:hypothetical protein